ncbi:MAG: 3'(2'),5'-bisphosphate nucleotidase CysQ [Deltaproteobacteria bacterium]|nr:3'(2'),5'-bisphosphate nucleotidase CysQ [Deltaproteobacteria bacterium]
MKSLLFEIRELAFRAGAEILKVYASGVFETSYKEEGSPLTLADRRSNEVIAKGLSSITPHLPVLSEESRQEGYARRRDWGRFWMVDPLDGTKEFIKRNGEFTVNIALIEGGRAILGVVFAPVLGVCYLAAKGEGAFRVKNGFEERIYARPYSGGPLRVVASRSHRGPELEAFLGRLSGAELVNMGSSLKLCLVAEGAAHLYPRFGPTMEWDTAAAQCVVEEAGGSVTDMKGQRLLYNKEDLLNPYFIVSGGNQGIEQIL